MFFILFLIHTYVSGFHSRGQKTDPDIEKTQRWEKNTTCPHTSLGRLIRVLLTEISIASLPSCSDPPLNSSRLGKNIFQAGDRASAGQTGSAHSGARCDSYGDNNLVLAPEGSGGGGYFS